ncbi:unnamed protein product [Caenorhabditis auriculariae]|uniref:Eukaryotic translation initiation factor 3 subunit C n=1 Tax=Caenorhabditis auriculariae TaxID=2777116 RepID=A0A8S1H3V0_9PELO|nr:unnamed protein product [Caenorhabditis auriculariae]
MTINKLSVTHLTPCNRAHDHAQGDSNWTTLSSGRLTGSRRESVSSAESPADPRVLTQYPPNGIPPGPPYMEQHPVVSYPPQQPPWHPGMQPQQPPIPPVCMQERQNAPVPYPRSPSRMPPTAVNPQTIHWMTQHYGYAYSNSPVPSVTPSVMSAQMYGDNMSMLSVNTNVTATNPVDPSQRCFSSNGSTTENINPNLNMALLQSTRQVDEILNIWFSSNLMKRVEMANIIWNWAKGSGLTSIDEVTMPNFMQRIVHVIIDGLWCEINNSGGRPPPKDLDVSYRLIEILHRILLTPCGLHFVSLAFRADFQPQNQPLLRDAICPFVGIHNNQPQVDRRSKLLIEIIWILITQNDANARTQCLKSLKITQNMVPRLVQSLKDGHFVNSRLLHIFLKLTYKDKQMKESLFHYGSPQNLTYLVLHCFLPKSMQNPSPERRGQLISDACRLLKSLVHDTQSIDNFIRVNGIQIICELLKTITDKRIIRDALILFKEVSDSEVFKEFLIPVDFIIYLMHNFQDENIFQHGTGFLINITANKPRYKEIAIKSGCVQLLESIISRCPEIFKTPDDKKGLILDILSNSCLTLNNLLPFWFSGGVELVPQAQQILLATVQRFLCPEVLRKFLNLLVFEDVSWKEQLIELRNNLLRLLTTIFRTPVIQKDRIFEVFDEIRHENIIGTILHVFSIAKSLYADATNDGDKKKRETLILRSLKLLEYIMTGTGSNMVMDIRKAIINFFRHNTTCPLDIINEKSGDSLIVVLLEFCTRLLEVCGEAPLPWTIDRLAVEGLANRRNADIASAAQNLLRKMPVSASEFEPLAEVFANTDYQNVEVFFRGGHSSDSDSESSEDEVQEQKIKTKPSAYRNDFELLAEGEDDQRRVVRTQKDRKFDELKDLIKLIRNARSNKDLNKMLSVFDDLLKSYEKSRTIFQRQNISMPRFFISAVVELEDYLTNLWEDKEAKAALSKLNTKALSAMRQKVRKYVKEIEDKIKEYRESPDPAGYETPEEELIVGDDEEEDLPIESVKTKVSKAKDLDNEKSDMDTDSSAWTTEPDTDDSDTGEDEIGKMEKLRRLFLKKEFRDDKGVKKDNKRVRVQKKETKNVDRESDDDEEWTPVSREKTVVLFDPKEEITHEVMIKKINEIMSLRGRLTTDRKQHVKNLQKLYEKSVEKNLGAGILVKITFCIISALFELNSKISDYMEYPNFMKTLGTVNELLDMLIEHPNVKLSVTFSEEDENLKDETEDYRIQGSVLMAVQRLDTELTKILQNADCHSNDYIEKLKGEKDMCTLIERTQKYIEERIHLGIFDQHEVCKVYMMRIEHFYYKYKEHYDGEGNVAEIMDYLCKRIYALDEEKRLRQRAMLCHVYWLALHDEWHRARDTLLMSHMQAIVDHSDTDTQILYNRTICQLGLCAFRHGFIREAHQGLSEIQNTQRAKELLAQAVGMRQHERTAEQEKVERQRQIPYHMHINVELMECVYLICSMLLEIPHMASCEVEMRRRLLSRSFHYQLKQSEKASLIGPPENTREHVVAASRAMLAGDWKKCRDYIVNDKMNQKVWNLFRNSERVKEMVVRRIQEEALRTYLLMYSTVYATVSLKKLSELFELSKRDVHSIISKMIIQEELSATLDEPTDCLIMHRVEPSRLQMLALNLADKLQTLSENTEQILEPRTNRGGYAGPGSWFQGRNERQGDKQKGDRSNYQGDRRTGPSDGKRGAWGQVPVQQTLETMGKKKAFIEKRNAQKFRLIPQSAAEECTSERFAPTEEHLEEQHKFGIFYDDDYNYMQHLRDVNEKMKLEEVGSTVEERVVKKTVIKVPFIPPPPFGALGPQKTVEFVDNDVQKALEGDLTGAGELEDDFIALAGGALDDRIMTYRSNFDEEDDDDEEGIFDGYEEEGEDEEDEESCVTRETAQRDIDQAFDLMMENEYDDDGLVGELDAEDTDMSGVLEPNSGRLKRLAAEVPKDPEYDEKLAKQYVRERLRLIEEGVIKEDEETEMVEVEESSRKRIKWDCESFATQYTNIYNHPTLIKEPRGKQLSRKNLKWLDKQAEKMDTAEEEDELMEDEDEEDDDASQCTVSTFRPKGETPEQRRLRKLAVKESRRARRQEKKANKTAFATESRKMAKGRIGQLKAVPLP